MVPNAANQKRRGFGSFLSSKPPAETAAPSNDSQLPVAPASASNKAASSGNTHITPIENHGQVANVNEQRNLAVNERTGEVIDDDTGEVLTVTTTTTTVTKTETRRSRSPQPPPHGNNAFMQEQAVRETKQQTHLDPSSALNPPNTNATLLQHRTSNDTFSQQSYSFDSSTNSALQPNDPGQWQQKSARENLKSAATGLQDVRSSLRGTLSTSDIAIPRRNPARGSRVQQAPPVPPIPSSAPVLPQLQTGQSHWQAPWPEPAAETIEEEDVGESDRLKKRKSLSSMPASFSPESSGQLEREKSPRLFKRAKNKKLVA